MTQIIRKGWIQAPSQQSLLKQVTLLPSPQSRKVLLSWNLLVIFLPFYDSIRFYICFCFCLHSYINTNKYMFNLIYIPHTNIHWSTLIHICVKEQGKDIVISFCLSSKLWNFGFDLLKYLLHKQISLSSFLFYCQNQVPNLYALKFCLFGGNTTAMLRAFS